MADNSKNQNSNIQIDDEALMGMFFFNEDPLVPYSKICRTSSEYEIYFNLKDFRSIILKFNILGSVTGVFIEEGQKIISVKDLTQNATILLEKLFLRIIPHLEVDIQQNKIDIINMQIDALLAKIEK